MLYDDADVHRLAASSQIIDIRLGLLWVNFEVHWEGIWISELLVKQEIIYHFLIPEKEEFPVEDEFHIPVIIWGIKTWNGFNVLLSISRNLIKVLIVVDNIMVCPTIITLFFEISGISNSEDKVTSIVDQELKINLPLSSIKRCVEQPIVFLFELIKWLLPLKTSLELEILL